MAGTDTTTPQLSTRAMLDRTLAFERLIDAVVDFQVHTGALVAVDGCPPLLRATYRDALIQFLNEHADDSRREAERVAVQVVLDAVPPPIFGRDMARTRLAVQVRNALAIYRRRLRDIPIPGIWIEGR